jgi:DNA-binding protein HU-beta
VNKTDLIESIAARTTYTKSSIEEVVNLTIASIMTAIEQGNDVTLLGFGTFTKSDHKPRVGRNPKTGEKVNIPARSVPRFKPGKDFRAKLSC